MTSKRKAALQRKLTLASVPRPPEDLADRIKSDIPKYLNVEAERRRFASSIGFNLRIAASIIVLVSIASLMFVYAPQKREMPATASQAKEAAPATVAPAAMDEVSVEIAQAAPQAAATAAPPPAMVPAPATVAPVQIAEAAPRMQRRDRAADAREERTANVEGGVEGSVVGGVAGGTVGGVIGGIVTDRVAAAPPPPPAEIAVTAGAPAIAAAPEPPAPSRAAQKLADTSLVTEAYAAPLPLSPKAVFGISTDPEVFRRIKSTIEHGARPSASAVNVEALINYFAGAPAKRVRRGVRLEVEASPAPVGVNGHHGILRFTVDTASVDVPERGSNPPIASNARLEIELNGETVAHFTPIGDSTPITESALLHNVSVTGLYALDLKTPVNQRETIATVHLHYTSIEDGKKHTITRVLRGSDFAKQWTKASKRHRLASLGALWGESLRGTGGGPDVARRAEELASQAPDDARARELAEVAIASSGGR